MNAFEFLFRTKHNIAPDFRTILKVTFTGFYISWTLCVLAYKPHEHLIDVRLSQVMV
jgi:hypothetical protein